MRQTIVLFGTEYGLNRHDGYLVEVNRCRPAPEVTVQRDAGDKIRMTSILIEACRASTFHRIGASWNWELAIRKRATNIEYHHD